MAISVGSVSVDVVPDARRFVPDLRAKLGNLPAVQLPVQAATQAASAAIDKVAKAPRTATVNVAAETTRAKADVDALQKQIRDKTLQLNVDTSEAKARLAQLQSDIAQAKAAVKLNADDTQAKAKLDALKQEAANVKAQVELDTAPARAEIARLKAEADRGKVTVQAEADTRKAEAELARVAQNRTANIRVDDQGSILSSTNRLGALLTAGVALGPAIVPAAAAAAAAVGAIGIGALAGVAGIGTLVLGFSGVSDAVKALSAAQTTSARDAAKNSAAQVAAAEQVRSAEAGLVNTRANAADAAVRAAQAVADAQRGVRDATREAGRSVQDALAAQATAQRGVEDATRAAAAGVQSALQQQVAAQRGVEDATRAATRSVADALFAQEQAEESLARAQADARTAQLSLNQARDDAKRSLEDLTLQVEDGALAQRRAVLSVQDAQDSLNKTLADPKATARQRQQAQLAYDEAVQNLDEIGVRNQRLAKEKADADKAGINGSKQVQAATAGIAAAEQRVQDAQTQAARAADATTQARVAGEQSVAQARQRAAQADAAVTEAQRAGDERVLVARQALAKAEQGVADARVAGDRRVADAQRAVSQAVASQVSQQRQSAAAIVQAQAAVASAHRQAALAASAQSTSLNKVDDAMKALTPSGKAFALFLFSLKGRFDALKATAQSGLLPGVQAGIQALLPLLPILNRIVGNAAAALGELFAQAGKALSAPFWVDFFNMIANTVGPNLKVFGGIILNLATGFAGLLMAFQPLNAQLGAGLLNLSQRFAEFGTTVTSTSGFQAFMAYVQQVGPLIIATITSLATTIGRVIVALAPLGPIVLASIGFLADTINRIPIPVLRALLITFGALVLGIGAVNLATSAYASITATITNLTKAWEAAQVALNFVLDANPIGLVIIALVALGAALVITYRNSATFRNIVNAAWSGVRTAVSVSWERVIKPALSALADFMTKTVPNAFRSGGAAIDGAWTATKNRVAAVWNIGIRAPFNALRTFITATIPAAFRAGGAAIDAAWTATKNRIAAVWNIGIKAPFNALKDFITLTIPTAFRSGGTGIDRAWTAIKNRILDVWRVGIHPALFALWSYITQTLPGAFTTGVAAIKTAWDKIKDYAKEPIRFIVTTVLNNGLIAAFNKIDGALGNPVTPIQPLQLPKGFARGTEDHRAQIAHPNQPRLWAEPETGGEAYIPLAPSKRPRSARILGDVAQRFGYGLVRMANGGTLITAGRHLRDLGYDVSEGPDGFGPIHHVHAPHSRHYDGMAIDINHGAGTSKTEQAALSRIVPYLQGLGLRIIFMAPGHYNHLHAEVPRSKGLASQIGHLIGGAAGAVTGAVKGAAGAVAGALDPSQLIMGPLSGLLAKLPGAGSPFGQIVAGAPKAIATMLVNKAKEFVGLGSGDTKDFPAGGGGEFGGGAGTARWRGIVTRVVAMLGQPASAVDSVLRRIQFESGGNPTAVNRTDINAQMGHPSQGLMQVIPGTFVAYAGPYRGRGITDPLANIFAGSNYALHRYHSLAAIDPQVRPRGYDAGGFLQPGLTTVYNGTGKPEPVFTPEQWATLRAGGGTRAGVTINGDVHTASVEEFMREAGARQRLDEALHPIFA